MFSRSTMSMCAMVVFLAFSIVGLSSGCASPPPEATGGVTTITYWSSDTAQSTIQLVNSFNQQNQGKYRFIRVAIMAIGAFSTNYRLLMALTLFSVIPMVLAFLFAQKQLVQGVATSGMKE